MKITIIGWYGTETIGDRAILAGILKSIGNNVEKIFLGSLYPFFTKRTIFEDNNFYKKYLGLEQDIEIFTSKKIKELEKCIDASDVLIMGGGPLMHINPLYMVNYAFKYARKRKKRTILLGNGIGPIFFKRFEKVLLELVKNSDDIVLRDSVSREVLMSISKKYKVKIEREKIKISHDPSLIAISGFLEKEKEIDKKNKEIVVNLREFPKEYARDESQAKNANNNLELIIKELDKKQDSAVLLLPNHYFFIGGDDRDYYNHLKFTKNFKNIKIQNKPLSLEQTFRKIKNARHCIGMRFHSVIFQLFLNGDNVVFDYTEPRKGKIFGFLNDINFDFERYHNLQDSIDVEEIKKVTSGEVPQRIKFEIDQHKLDIFNSVIHK